MFKKIPIDALVITLLVIAGGGVILTGGKATFAAFAFCAPLALYVLVMVVAALYNGGKALWRRYSKKKDGQA